MRLRVTRSLCLTTAALLSLIAATPATRPAATRPGGLSYRLEGDPTTWDAAAKDKIVKAMDEAMKIYNANGQFDFVVPVVYSPQTPTADANYRGHIRFGGQIGTRTALHELGHILGVGTYKDWNKFVQDGKWTGPHAIAQLKQFDGPDAVPHADRQHFWPYGLNYDKEGTDAETFRRHVLMVIALRQDMGLQATTRPTHG